MCEAALVFFQLGNCSRILKALLCATKAAIQQNGGIRVISWRWIWVSLLGWSAGWFSLTNVPNFILGILFEGDLPGTAKSRNPKSYCFSASTTLEKNVITKTKNNAR